MQQVLNSAPYYIYTILYKGVFDLGLLLPFMIFAVSLSYYYYKRGMSTKWAKPATMIFFFIPLLIFIFLKPAYTFEQAKQLIYESAYDVSHTEIPFHYTRKIRGTLFTIGITTLKEAEDPF